MSSQIDTLIDGRSPEKTIMEDIMLDAPAAAATPPSACPMSVRVPLGAHEELGVPNHKRLVAEYLTDESGTRELHLYYGEREVVFDEPELFAFGEALTQHPRFVAGAAATWCPAADWPRAQELLEHLLMEGILRRTAELDAELTGAQPSPLPPAPCKTPRSWVECEAITRELLGRPLELGYLELVIPIYRVAHIFLDAERRQVGEANVFPRQLRVDVPTDWRACPHAGSRYRDVQPMNVTALKSMRVYWQPAMIMLSRIRAAFMQRFPHIAREGWTIGDLERLSSLVLAVPAYQMLRTPNPVPNGELHPVLSSMYRVTDGVRLTMHHMLFVPTNEATRSAETSMSAAELYSYAERNAVFLSEYGVCAGPGALIEEFLRVLIDGEAVPGADGFELAPALSATLQDLEYALDYGLYGLQAHAVTFWLWAVVGRAYERAWRLVQSWPSSGPEHYEQFRARLERSTETLVKRSYVGSETMRVSRDRAFANMFDNCALGLQTRSCAASLAECLALETQLPHTQTAIQLHALLGRRLRGVQLPSGGIAELTTILMECFRCEQAVVKASTLIASCINTLLGRDAPQRTLTIADIRMLWQLDEAQRQPPALAVDLEQSLGLSVVVDAAAITITALDVTVENDTVKHDAASEIAGAQLALQALQREGLQRLVHSLHRAAVSPESFGTNSSHA